MWRQKSQLHIFVQKHPVYLTWVIQDLASFQRERDPWCALPQQPNNAAQSCRKKLTGLIQSYLTEPLYISSQMLLNENHLSSSRYLALEQLYRDDPGGWMYLNSLAKSKITIFWPVRAGKVINYRLIIVLQWPAWSKNLKFFQGKISSKDVILDFSATCNILCSGVWWKNLISSFLGPVWAGKNLNYRHIIFRFLPQHNVIVKKTKNGIPLVKKKHTHFCWGWGPKSPWADDWKWS